MLTILLGCKLNRLTVWSKSNNGGSSHSAAINCVLLQNRNKEAGSIGHNNNVTCIELFISDYNTVVDDWTIVVFRKWGYPSDSCRLAASHRGAYVPWW